MIATNSTSIIEIRSKGEIKGHLTIKYDHTMAERIMNSFTYFDFLRVGWKIQLTVAIDYTKSNEEQELHGDGSSEKHEYVNALKKVTEILLPYDGDKQIPLFGFGGIPKGMKEVSHCFPLNGNNDNPEISGGVGPMLELYSKTLPDIGLSGPTLFRPVLKHFQHILEKGKNLEDPRHYHVLLILTDGCITDMQATRKILVELSAEPVSVIIIGCGEWDFGEMDELDGDQVRLTDDDGRKARRDIVQFVNF